MKFYKFLSFKQKKSNAQLEKKIHHYCVTLICTNQKLPIFFQKGKSLLIIPLHCLQV